MSKYYACRSLAFFDRISGVLALIAAMFTVTWIQRHQELTALLAAGVPKARVVAPIVIAAGSISLLAWANRELVIPQIRDNLARDAKNLKGTVSQDLQPKYDYATNILLRGAATLARERRIEKPSFMLPLELSQYGKHLIAEEAFYQPATDEHPGGYLLTGVSQPEGICSQPSIANRDGPVVLTPRDHKWLKADEVFVVSGVTFEMLTGTFAWRNYSSTWQLIDGLDSPSYDFGADVRVAIHSRLVRPLLDVTLLFLGLPLVLARGNRNVFAAIGLCGAIGILFMLVVLVCQYLGAGYWLSPALAAWLPLMLFVPVAIALADPFFE
jgi:lipopolysaccharide export system permease protein